MQNDKNKKSMFSTGFQIKDEEKVPALILLVVVFAFVLVYFFLMPVATTYRSNRIALENLKIDQSVLEEKQQKLQNLDKTIKEKKSFIDQTKEVLPENPQVAEALVLISKLAKDNGLYINNFIPKPVDDTASVQQPGTVRFDYKRVELQIDITGNYPNLKKFVESLENNVRPVNIVNIAIKGGGEIKRGASDLLRFNLKGYIYYQ